MNTIKVAILGLGTVGTGVYKLIQKRADVMERTAGAKLEVKKILVRNMQKKREGVEQELLTDNWKEILEDDEISVVIEVMGGLEPAKTMILEALEAGKNVVSANKDLIAEEGHVLLDTAQKNQVDFLFEAAVAGGIPIIRPLKQCLAANDISEIVGIPYQDDRRGNGFCRCTEKGTGTWICRGRPYCGRGRTGCGKKSGDHGIHRISFQSCIL